MDEEGGQNRLITICDKDMKAAGLAHDEASAALAFAAAVQMYKDRFPGEELDFVRIVYAGWAKEYAEPIAAPGEPQADLDGVATPTSTPGISSLVLVDAPDHESAAWDRHVVSTASPNGRSALPASLQDIEESHAAARQITETSASMLGLRLDPDGRGVCFGDIQRVAHALHCTAELLPGFEIMLRGRMGERYCRSFGEAARCLNGKTFKPEALYG